MREFSDDALPPYFHPPCGHGTEVAGLRRCTDGAFRALCGLCTSRGEPVPMKVLAAHLWRLPDVDPEMPGFIVARCGLQRELEEALP